MRLKAINFSVREISPEHPCRAAVVRADVKYGWLISGNDLALHPERVSVIVPGF